MNKLMLALVAGSMSLAVAGAYAATGSPADTDKAGRAGPGTAAGEMGAAKPGPTAPGSAAGSGMSKGGASSSATTGPGTSGASATSGSSGASATSGTGEPKAGRRARRASKG